MRFSKHEHEVMQLLWEVDRPLSKTEIVELSVNKSWKPSTIHLLLNSLLDKGGIEVDGFTRTGRNFGRTFSAAITEEAYAAQQIVGNLGHVSGRVLVGVVSTLLDVSSVDLDTLDELEKMLKAKKKELDQ